MKPDRKQDPKVFLIAREVELARILAGNDPKARDKALKSLGKLLQKRADTMPFTEEDFQRIWKGLFYCMWMSDKPLVQEECAERISKLVHFADFSTSLLFFKAGLFIVSQEWTGIDQLRLDKFLMLIRRLLREAFQVLKKYSFVENNIKSFNEAISETVLNKEIKTPVGLFMHFNEIFLEELAKVSEGKIQSKSVVTFLQPFIQRLVKSDDGREIGYIKKFIFNYLMRQSDVGMDYQEKYEAWKQQGFPGSINSMQKVKVDEDDEDESSGDDEVKEKTKNRKVKPMDPRAGRVDVEIPQLRFRAKDVANALSECKFDKKSSTNSRQAISALIQQFNKLSNGVYPLGIHKIDVKDKNEAINIRKSANKLIKFEQKLLGKDRKRKRDKENNEKHGVEKKRIKLENQQKESIKPEKNKTKPGKNQELANGENPVAKKLKKKNKEKHLQESTKNNRTGNENTSKKVVENKSHNSKENKSKSEKNKSEIISISTAVPKTKKNKKSLDVIENKQLSSSSIVKAKDKLKNKKNNKLNKKLNGKLGSNIECIIERSSGTWVVYEVESSLKPGAQQSSGKSVGVPVSTSAKHVKKDQLHINNLAKEKNGPKKSPASSPKEQQQGIVEASKSGKRQSPVKPEILAVSNSPKNVKKNGLSINISREEKFSPKKSPGSIATEPEQGIIESSKLGLTPVRLFESTPEKKELFPKTEWDEPLQEGEYEICIPSKKYVGKLKKQKKFKDQTVHELINTTLEKIRGKSRLSLDSRLVSNPFAKTGSAKKVKINTNLNKSQEVYEHIANVKSSPAIPYDASRKPSKPLLKPTANSTPINPFYKKQLNIF
ncbi:uncharacterized protein [Diabrotica undecimpunctata]|uniref:uncharacterized protein isoform X1 n=1 Tax=Diabrotica undecimpunctata TaxID=50387 RepID=UPI003B63372A